MKKESKICRCIASSAKATFIVSVIALALVWLRRNVDRQTLQRRFWQPVYDRFAKLYDAVDWLTGYTTHRLRQRALAYLPPAGARVLEVGFGSGRLHVELAARYRMAGLDRAPGMARLTARRLASAATATERDLSSALCVGTAEALPYPDASFDAVVSTFAFSAFPDADAAMDEMVRLLKPGGRVVIVDAGEAKDGNLTAKTLAALWEALGDYMRDEVPLMKARGLKVQREDYGPWNSVHVVVGERPERS
jgi:ubiquinone/menaquinone biosynthesis C-methylase UbiE